MMTYFQIINAETSWIYLAFGFLFSVFYFITLEEYYFGSLDFPIVNAVNEGTTSTSIILLVGVFAGNDFYSKEIIQEFNIYQVIFIGLFCLVVLQNIAILIKLFRKFSILDVLHKNCLFVYSVISYVLVVCLASNDAVWKYSKVILYIYTIVFSRIIISIMIAHIFESNFNQFQVFPLFVSTFLLVLALYEFFFISGKDSFKL
jgi:hypothetical protein